MARDNDDALRKQRLTTRREKRDKRGPLIVADVDLPEVFGWFDEGLSDLEITHRLDARFSYNFGDKMPANVAEKALDAIDTPAFATMVVLLRKAHALVGAVKGAAAAPGRGLFRRPE